MQKKKGKLGLFGGNNQKGNANVSIMDKKSGLNSNFKDPITDFLICDGVLKKYNGNNTIVNIPAELGITSIGQKAFFRRTDIKAINIPDNVTSIANYAFAGCENLESIGISDNVNFIGNYAFENCKSLTQVNLPDRLISVGSYLFSGCQSLLNVHLPSELKSIGNYMFNKCESLTTITISNKVTSIGWKAFSGCSSLVEVNFPNALNSIGNYAFENCFKLESISLSANITSLGEGVFFMCKNLHHIDLDSSNATYKIVDNILYSFDDDILYVCPAKAPISNGQYIIPEGVKSICYGAFSSCLNLQSIYLPNTVETIDHCAFFNCMNLQKINLPDTIKTLGKNVFHNCCSLTNISLPTSITEIEPGTFSGCENLRKVNMTDNVHTIGEISFFGCVNLEEFTFPTNLTAIGCAAFTNCQKLTQINIHKNINNIAKGAFSHCNSLVDINVSPENMTYSSSDGVLYSKNQAYLLVYPAGKTETSFVIPSTVKYINDQAFYGVLYLQEVTIPSSIQDIGISAFSEMPALSKVTIEEGIKNIGTFVFSKNKNLSLVSFPRSVTTIDSSAFTECDNLSFVCPTDSFAYKFATIKNISIYSERKNNFEANSEQANNSFYKDAKQKSKGGFTLFGSKKQKNITKQEEKAETTESLQDAVQETITEPIQNQYSNADFDFEENNDINNTFENTKSNFVSANNTETDNSDFNYSDNDTTNTSSYEEDLGFEIAENDDNSFMSDISDLFDNITEPEPLEESSHDNYYSSYDNNSMNTIQDPLPINNYPNNNSNNNGVINGNFDNSLLFSDEIINRNSEPLRKDSNAELPNTDGGIQPEYSSPNKIQNVVVKQNSTNSVILSWEPYPGAKEYHLLHFNTKTKLYDDVSKIKTNKALLTGIIPSHTQQYKIVAYGYENYKRTLLASSRPVSISTSLPAVTGLESIAATSNSLSFSWNSIPDAVKYVIFAYNSIKKTFVPVDECVENYITLSNLVGVSSLRVKVAAIKIIHNNECMTLLSDEVVAYTTLSPVSGIVMSAHTSSSIKLNWLAIPGVNAYKVYVFNPQSDRFEYADTTPVNQIVFNNLMPSREYRYKVRACIITEDNEIMGPPSSIIRAETTPED